MLLLCVKFKLNTLIELMRSTVTYVACNHIAFWPLKLKQSVNIQNEIMDFP